MEERGAAEWGTGAAARDGSGKKKPGNNYVTLAIGGEICYITKMKSWRNALFDMQNQVEVL
jgi:hypothetical protein